MVNYYKQEFSLYRNGIHIYSRYSYFLAEDTNEKIKGTSIIPLTWDNLEKHVSKHYFPIVINETRKGRKVSFYYFYNDFDDVHTPSIKEWKTPDLGLSYRISPAEIMQVSIKDILNASDSDLAIRYLVQRGMTVFDK